MSGITRFLLSIGLFAVPMMAAARTAAGQPRAPRPKPLAELSRTILAGRDSLVANRTVLPVRDSLVAAARNQVGLRYRWGAKQPGYAFDCSALVQWVAGLFGRDMPRTAAEQARVGIEVPKDTTQLLPGDLLVFGKGRRITHIGIYVGDGRYVHAANKRKGIIESDIDEARKNYWKGVRRIFLDADSTFTPAPVLSLPES
jgi:cell wall-associated NlpC family hydrolase